MIDNDAEVRLRALLRAAWARAAAAAERDSGWVPCDDRDAILYTAALALDPLIPTSVPVHVAANSEDHEDLARLIGAGFQAGGPRWFAGPCDMTLIAATDAGPPFEVVALYTLRSRFWYFESDPFDRTKPNPCAWDLARLLAVQSKRHVWTTRCGVYEPMQGAADRVVATWGREADEVLVVLLPEGLDGDDRKAAVRMWSRGEPVMPWIATELESAISTVRSD